MANAEGKLRRRLSDPGIVGREGSILDVGAENGVVDKKGAWIQFEGELIGKAKKQPRRLSLKNPSWEHAS
jgi:recombination protein RecA